MSSFFYGKYLTWTLTGEVAFEITWVSGPNAVISGVFFDPVSVPMAYTGGFVSVPSTVETNEQLNSYLVTHPIVGSPTFDATFAPVTVTGYPVAPYGTWIANGPNSEWMGPDPAGVSTRALAPFVNTAGGFDPYRAAP